MGGRWGRWWAGRQLHPDERPQLEAAVPPFASRDLGESSAVLGVGQAPGQDSGSVKQRMPGSLGLRSGWGLAGGGEGAGRAGDRSRAPATGAQAAHSRKGHRRSGSLRVWARPSSATSRPLAATAGDAARSFIRFLGESRHRGQSTRSAGREFWGSSCFLGREEDSDRFHRTHPFQCLYG